MIWCYVERKCMCLRNVMAQPELTQWHRPADRFVTSGHCLLVTSAIPDPEQAQWIHGASKYSARYNQYEFPYGRKHSFQSLKFPHLHYYFIFMCICGLYTTKYLWKWYWSAGFHLLIWNFVKPGLGGYEMQWKG